MNMRGEELHVEFSSRILSSDVRWKKNVFNVSPLLWMWMWTHTYAVLRVHNVARMY